MKLPIKSTLHSNPCHIFSLILCCLTLSGCVMLNGISQRFNAKTTVETLKIPDRWQATLPHEGSQANLTHFWQQFHDPLLLSLIKAAEKESASLETAKSRIAQAHSKLAQVHAALSPSVDGNASASRSVQQPSPNFQSGGLQGGNGGAFNSAQIVAQSSWEIDMFGANHAILESTQVQEKAANAGWHEARVSIAAELANAYFNERYCELQIGILKSDLSSRAQTLKLTNIVINAGFSAPSDANLAKASLADATQQLKAQQGQCDLDIKALVALSNLDETVLRKELANQTFTADVNGVNNLFKLNEIPASILAQRPDIYSAEADLITAAADVKNAYVQGLPKVSINGSIGWMWLSGTGFSTNGKTWSLGPISISFPIYHGEVQKAGLTSAETSYAEKASIYRSKVRYAVKEVEEALVNLHSADTRQTDIMEAVNGYRASFDATDAKVKAGFANLIELEEQRRSLLLAETTRLNNLKQRTQAWISLYRAAGGGWQKDEPITIEATSVK